MNRYHLRLDDCKQNTPSDGCDTALQAAIRRNTDVSQLTLREIGNALYERPAIQNGGPTHFDVLPVLPKTDTKSYEDWHRTCGHLDEHCEPSVKVKLVHTDGQGSITGTSTLHAYMW